MPSQSKASQVASAFAARRPAFVKFDASKTKALFGDYAVTKGLSSWEHQAKINREYYLPKFSEGHTPEYPGGGKSASGRL